MHSAAAALRHKLAAWSRNQAVVQTVRATTAATIAYAVAVQLSPEKAPPITAPLTALLVVQVTLFATLKMGFRRVNAVLVGVLIAIGFSTLVGLSWWSLALVILAALTAGRLVRANEFVNEVAISAMLILAVSGSAQGAWARVLDTLIGATVGLIFNLLLAPPVWVRTARESMEELARRMRQLLLEISEALGTPIPVSRTTARLEEARRLDMEIANVDISLRQAEDSLRFNPRVREAQLNSAVLRTGLDTLEVCAVILRVLARSLTDLSTQREEEEPLIPERIAPDLESLFVHVGGALVSFSVLVTTQLSQNAEDAEERLTGELTASRDTRDKVARLLLELIQDNPHQWQHFGALLAQIDRVLDELSPEQRSQRLMDELDRHTREQLERHPRLARLGQRLSKLRQRL
ncbi:aromatic acid exporter family protein [Streptomyces iconiensis]|uniref:Aromatic acid exporter family protein n=1 Tax=Streptomyces iconiensis TaxID=1384038 RepID=A0ABT7A249_9ACTN|nr:FUSC family protein [Streptomyces iconiensis]MDJ1134921.1 aromatic acid exporter family protein [Streptomyces iconiensis]